MVWGQQKSRAVCSGIYQQCLKPLSLTRMQVKKSMRKKAHTGINGASGISSVCWIQWREETVFLTQLCYTIWRVTGHLGLPGCIVCTTQSSPTRTATCWGLFKQRSFQTFHSPPGCTNSADEPQEEPWTLQLPENCNVSMNCETGILNEALWMEISLPCIISFPSAGQIKQNLSLKHLAVLPLSHKKITYPLPPTLQDNHCLLYCPPGHRDLRHTAVLLFAEAVEGRATTSPS